MTTEPQSLLDAAENVVIAYGMGWDMEGVIENLRAAVAREELPVCRICIQTDYCRAHAECSYTKSPMLEPDGSSVRWRRVAKDHPR